MNIKVHIGAHKTATTHFQDNLKNFILNGQFNEINYIHRDAIRKGKYVTRLMDEPNIYRSLKLRLGLAEPAPWSEAALLCNSNVELCLISEENIMGKPKDILEGFYLKAASRVCKFINDIKTKNVTIFMSIRNYDELFTSAYSQVLRAGKKVKYFDASWQNFINGNRGWPSVVKEISDAVPDVKIVIWRFEDYIKDPSQYLEMFSGVSFENHQDWVYPDFTRRLSESQIAAIEDRRLNWLGLNQVRKKKLEGIIKNVVAEGVFSPVSESDKEASLKRYVNDCDLLSNVNNVTFMNI